MRVYPITLLAAAVFVAAACRRESAGPEATTSAQIVASQVGAGVRVTNLTDRPVAYAVWNRGWLALFGPCTDAGPSCPRLAPGASVTVPYSEIAGYDASATEASVRWWHVLPGPGGGLHAGEVHEVIVPL